MLTKKQNFLETIRGGNPNRFVNQYEFITVTWDMDPISRGNPHTLGTGAENQGRLGRNMDLDKGHTRFFPGAR
jgi:hypothetical protein